MYSLDPSIAIETLPNTNTTHSILIEIDICNSLCNLIKIIIIKTSFHIYVDK